MIRAYDYCFFVVFFIVSLTPESKPAPLNNSVPNHRISIMYSSGPFQKTVNAFLISSSRDSCHDVKSRPRTQTPQLIVYAARHSG